MNTNYKIILAFILGIIARLFTNPWILGYTDTNYSVHKNKIYDSIFFGSIIGIIQIIIDIGSLTNGEKIFWLILYISIFLTIKYIINNQIFIDDKHLLLKLKENYAESNKITKILLNDSKLKPEINTFVSEQLNIKNEEIKIINEFIKNLN
jgi:hypothetical protein